MSLSKIPRNGSVAVIGAGVSGLSFSYFLTKLRPDIKINIFESQKQPGGWIKTINLQQETNENVLLEKGPRTLRGVSDGTLLIIDILKNIKSTNEIEVMESSSIGNRKYLAGKDHKLVRVPSNFKSAVKFFQNDIFKGGFKSILREPFVRTKLGENEDQSIREFFKRRFGSTLLCDNILSAIVHGIYAGDVGKLSVRSLFPRLVKLEESGSIIKGMIKSSYLKPEPLKMDDSLKAYESLISPKADLLALKNKLKPFPIIKLQNGLQQFPIKLASYLTKSNPNVTIEYESNIKLADPKTGLLKNGEKEYKFDHIRSTINTHQFANILEGSNLSKELSKIEYVSIFLANVYVSKTNVLIPKEGNGFGFLVPLLKENPEKLLGVIYDSDNEQNVKGLFNDYKLDNKKTDYEKITIMMGGHFYNKTAIPSPTILLESIESVLLKYLNVNMQNYNVIVRDEAAIADKKIPTLQSNDLLISYDIHKNCIPQFNVGYSDLDEKVKTLLSGEFQGRLSLGGMCFGKGVGVPDCVLNGLQDALKLV